MNDVMDSRPHPIQWKCEVHGEHRAVVSVQAISETKREVRRYCLFCIIDHLDNVGIKQAVEIK